MTNQSFEINTDQVHGEDLTPEQRAQVDRIHSELSYQLAHPAEVDGHVHHLYQFSRELPKGGRLEPDPVMRAFLERLGLDADYHSKKPISVSHLPLPRGAIMQDRIISESDPDEPRKWALLSSTVFAGATVTDTIVFKTGVLKSRESQLAPGEAAAQVAEFEAGMTKELEARTNGDRLGPISVAQAVDVDAAEVA